jgi:tetratricopeptide (TPR) repeat protein
MAEMTEMTESRFEVLRRKYEFLLIVFMAVIVFVIYAKTLTGDFIFDDVPNIKDNPHLRLGHITAENLLDAAFEGPSTRRPVAKLSFALNYYFHGYNVAGFHMVNILIHIANGVLLYLLISFTGCTPAMHRYRGQYRWIPFFSACVWLVHPIQTETVSYIVQRMTSLATMFYILSFLFYIRARLETANAKKTALFCAMAVSGLLALGSKEISATLPFFIILYEWYFFQDLSLTWIKNRAPLIVAVLILMVTISIIYLSGFTLEIISSIYSDRSMTMEQRVLTQFRVILYYIGLLLWPHPSRLNLDYDFQLSYSLLDPVSTLLSMTAIFAFLIFAVFTAKRQRLMSFCIIWYLGNLIIESSFIPLELVFEHRNYMPSMFFIFLGVLLSHHYLKPKWLPPLLLSAIVVICALWTFERNDVWRSPILIWKDTINKSPQKARPYNNLGVALVKRGYFALAVAQYRHALQLDPEFAYAHASLGHVLTKQGKTEEAIEHFQTALKLDPYQYEAHNNLGIALTIQGDHQQAIEHFSAAVLINPDYPEAHSNLGLAFRRQGRFQEAIVHFNVALKLDPVFVSAHNNLGLALADQGRLDEAVKHFTKALEINPDYAAVQRNLEETIAKKKRSGESPKD